MGIAPWVVGSRPSDRFPVWARGNVGEVFPNPVSPLTFTLVMLDGAEMGWRDAFDRLGAFGLEEFRPDELEVLGVFGSYCYLNASIARIYGERAPGLSAQLIDDLYFGAQPGIPPYDPRPGDADPDRTVTLGETFARAMTASRLDDVEADRAMVDALRADRPDIGVVSAPELWQHARDLIGRHFRHLFGQHVYVSSLSAVPIAALHQLTAAVGRPEAALALLSGLGDVDSAAPAAAVWQLGRQVRSSPRLTAAFDAGVPGVLSRLAGAGPEGAAVVARFQAFLAEFGSRGPDEWEVGCDTWQTRPELALTALDRMRLAPDEADPAVRGAAMAAARRAARDEVAAALAADPAAQARFLAAARAAAVLTAGRERTKANCVKLVHEARLCLMEVGRRAVEAGHADRPGDVALLTADEVEAWLVDPAPWAMILRARRALEREYAARQEPFAFADEQPPPDQWPLRAELAVEAVQVDDVLIGCPGCSGEATGRARVVLDPGAPGDLQPGDVLVAPLTDPSWTPLFVPAAAVVVDAGATQSHAVIVSRELGIPCVPSVDHATRRIPDGALVRVDGTRGTVTILDLG